MGLLDTVLVTLTLAVLFLIWVLGTFIVHLIFICLGELYMSMRGQRISWKRRLGAMASWPFLFIWNFADDVIFAIKRQLSQKT